MYQKLVLPVIGGLVLRLLIYCLRYLLRFALLWCETNWTDKLVCKDARWLQETMTWIGLPLFE